MNINNDLGLVDIVNKNLNSLIKDYSKELLEILETKGIKELKQRLLRDSNL